MKLKKQNYIHLAVLLAMYFAMVLILTHCFKYAYGSKLDWSAQHFAIPDIFRKQFYETGNLFPSFVFNIGAGENIYNLSYYGLYSPIIMFSYLFPFVPMYIYIQIISILGVCVSILLFYRWMLGKFSSRTAFFITLMFEFSSGLSLHSHRHIMFVSYMPFLLLAFNAVDDYFKGRRKYRLVLYTFLCIMCCYFFAVAAIAAIAVYGVYVYLQTTEKVTLRDLWKKGSHFAGRLFTAVMMSGVLLLPTFYCLLSGRDAGNSQISLFQLVPNSNLNFICYDSYGMGLTLTAVVAVLSAVFSKNKKHIRFMGITMMCLIFLPAFVFALNGTLYIDSKVLIPFMPLCLLLVGRLFEQLKDKTFAWKKCLPLTAVCTVIFVFLAKYKYQLRYALYTDLIMLAVLAAVYLLVKKKTVIYAGTAAASVLIGLSVNLTDNLEPSEYLGKLFSQDMYDITDSISNDEDLVRTANLVDRSITPNYIYNDDYLVSNIYSSVHNKRYNNFYFKRIHNENEFRNTALTTQSQSFLYQIYMGTKYLITDGSVRPSVLYHVVKQSGRYTLYESSRVMPLAYASSNVLNEDSYLNMIYPYSLNALMNNIVVSGGGADSYENDSIKRVDNFELVTQDGIAKHGKGYTVRLDQDVEFSVKLTEPVSAGELLLISFDVDNDMRSIGLSTSDAKIYIDGIKNNLTNPKWKYYNGNTTFEYVISAHNEQPLDRLRVKLMKGNYDIGEIKCYKMQISQPSSVDKFVFDKQKTEGDIIQGSIDVTNDGYFKMSVPYTEGFTAYVDGKKTEVECVDTSFVGFAISQGHHDIKIVFKAPMLRGGMLLSTGGAAILVILVSFEYYVKRRKPRKSEVKEK